MNYVNVRYAAVTRADLFAGDSSWSTKYGRTDERTIHNMVLQVSCLYSQPTNNTVLVSPTAAAAAA